MSLEAAGKDTDDFLPAYGAAKLVHIHGGGTAEEFDSAAAETYFAEALSNAGSVFGDKALERAKSIAAGLPGWIEKAHELASRYDELALDTMETESRLNREEEDARILEEQATLLREAIKANPKQLLEFRNRVAGNVESMRLVLGELYTDTLNLIEKLNAAENPWDGSFVHRSDRHLGILRAHLMDEGAATVRDVAASGMTRADMRTALDWLDSDPENPDSPWAKEVAAIIGERKKATATKRDNNTPGAITAKWCIPEMEFGAEPIGFPAVWYEGRKSPPGIIPSDHEDAGETWAALRPIHESLENAARAEDFVRRTIPAEKKETNERPDDETDAMRYTPDFVARAAHAIGHMLASPFLVETGVGHMHSLNVSDTGNAIPPPDQNPEAALRSRLAGMHTGLSPHACDFVGTGAKTLDHIMRRFTGIPAFTDEGETAAALWKFWEANGKLCDAHHEMSGSDVDPDTPFGLSREHAILSAGLSTVADLLTDTSLVIGGTEDIRWRFINKEMVLGAIVLREAKGDPALLEKWEAEPPSGLIEQADKAAMAAVMEEDSFPPYDSLDILHAVSKNAHALVPFFKRPENIHKAADTHPSATAHMLADCAAALNSSCPATRQVAEAEIMLGTMLWNTGIMLAAGGYLDGKETPQHVSILGTLLKNAKTLTETCSSVDDQDFRKACIQFLCDCMATASSHSRLKSLMLELRQTTDSANICEDLTLESGTFWSGYRRNWQSWAENDADIPLPERKLFQDGRSVNLNDGEYSEFIDMYRNKIRDAAGRNLREAVAACLGEYHCPDGEIRTRALRILSGPYFRAARGKMRSRFPRVRKAWDIQKAGISELINPHSNR